MSVRFEDRTGSVKEEIGRRKRIALTEAAIHLEGEIALRTPVDTGHLRASISHVAPEGRSQDGGGRLEGSADDESAYVGTNVEYAAYVEYGTKYQRPQPYMRTGFEAARGAMDRILKGGLNLGR